MLLPIYYLKNASLSFATKTLFKDLSFHLYPGDKICLIGPNGAGKSSLLKAIYGLYELDMGEKFTSPGTNIRYLAQEVSAYDTKQIVYDYILEENNEDLKYKADIMLDGLQIDGKLELGMLSGGQRRRAFLARILVQSPEILLLDEPTNHLDIASIEWLEDYIKSYKGVVICISHDREFLANTTNKLWWLNKGRLLKTDQGFKNFDTWQEEIINAEKANLEKMGKKLAAEETWLHQGISARRKRNQGRLENLINLREYFKRQQFKINNSNSKINPNILDLENKVKSRLIIEAEKISFYYNNKPIVKDFSISIQKGEKIGVIGPNGSGKTTLIKMLTGALKPSAGSIKIGVNTTISYFDQEKKDIKKSDTIWQLLCPNGGDTVSLPDKNMHVAGYLKHFMFDPKQLNDKIETLSGGQISRLILAKILAFPGSLLVLDEPTNDLDIDSLEMLQDILFSYKGTLIIVSHDRDFLERLATRTLIFEKDGFISDIMGGYKDYKRASLNKSCNSNAAANTKAHNQNLSRDDNIPKKLSYKYQRVLELNSMSIKQLEGEIAAIEKELQDVSLYAQDPEKFNRLLKNLEEKKQSINELEEEWLEALRMQESLEQKKT